MTKMEQFQEMLDKNNGYLFTAEVEAEGISSNTVYRPVAHSLCPER